MVVDDCNGWKFLGITVLLLVSICCYISESKFIIWLIVLLIETSYLNLIYLVLANTVNYNTITLQ